MILSQDHTGSKHQCQESNSYFLKYCYLAVFLIGFQQLCKIGKKLETDKACNKQVFKVHLHLPHNVHIKWVQRQARDLYNTVRVKTNGLMLINY